MTISTTEPLPLAAPPDAAELIDAAAGLVSPPAVCVKVLALVRSPNASASDFAALITLDPNLSARVLRIVNSAYYGFSRQVDSLGQAVTIIGIRDLANIVVALSAVRAFSKLGAGLVDLDTFWRHSVFVALTARRLGRHFGVEAPERLFIEGLLHDVGSALLYSAEPELADWMRAQAGSDECQIHALERQHLGFTHASLGAQLLKSWQLPESLLGAIADHHEIAAVSQSPAAHGMVQIADTLAYASTIGALGEPSEAPQDVITKCVAGMGGAIGVDELNALLDEVTEEFAETSAAFTG